MQEWIWAWLLVLALHCGTLEGMYSIQASCNDDVTLPCQVRDATDKYRYIVWYRNNIAVIKRKNNDVTFYNKSSPASLGVKESLVLRQVQPNDTGQYQCFLAADIGAKDIESYVSLVVSECETMVPTELSTADPLLSCPVHVLEIPALWAVLPFILFCLIKVGLCFIATLVCKKMSGSGGGGNRRQSSRKYSQQTTPSQRSYKI
ncbi:uncharacterized protein [Salminus brasiliensis]|uniref:uncharacterized protein n=1 Tax=Salminus brasiliensis TaxID=930266 RepID=UPI003B82CB7F